MQSEECQPRAPEHSTPGKSANPRRRGGGGGGGRSSSPLPRNVQVSKKLAWLLRHGAEAERLPLGPGGYACVADVLANRQIRSLGVTMGELRALVADNDKQRFALVPAESSSNTEEDNGAAATPTPAPAPDSDDARAWRIRANQGHSVHVASAGLLTRVARESGNVPATAVHGTSRRAWAAIAASRGLKRMGRNHVHLAAGLPAGFRSVVEQEKEGEAGALAALPPVISGMRNSSTVLVFVDVPKAMDGGLAFWLSDNGVILSEGNEDGMIPLDYFLRVEDRLGEGILVQDGKIVKEAPAQWAAKGNGERRKGTT